VSNFGVLLGWKFGQFAKNLLLEKNFNFNEELDSMKWKKVTYCASLEYDRFHLRLLQAREYRRQ
jgi:hypothetical protein